MWFPGPEMTAAFWTEAHVSTGSPTTAIRWVIADGEEGGATHARTYVLIANTSEADAECSLTLLVEGEILSTDGPRDRSLRYRPTAVEPWRSAPRSGCGAGGSVCKWRTSSSDPRRSWSSARPTRTVPASFGRREPTSSPPRSRNASCLQAHAPSAPSRSWMRRPSVDSVAATSRRPWSRRTYRAPSAGGTWGEILRNLGKMSPRAPWWRGAGGDAMAARIGQATLDCDELAEASDEVPIGIRFARSLVVLHLDPSRASHAAAAASGVGRANAIRGGDCAARDPCRHRGFDRDHVGTWHRRSPSRTDHRPAKT